ncbi:siderophore-interacting protein [Kitasatospora viridis]|uniref:NADPH-dependent ferric siderophore reductase n=1 Tax=Kitasatospora viridis TaxID=281105 RepID=A0A561TUW9_9ACTN|nr:siderophore-interacting protein [Kitasatospora viridis]TWF90908.1 NADPH-dependent ferric siderophore reductase [Kitasatospora viridis]
MAGPAAGAAADRPLLYGQYRFYRAAVLRTRRLGPTLVRVTLGGAELRGYAGGGRDQSFSLFLPHPGQPEPLLPIEAGEDWFTGWRELPEDERAVMRSYTVRAHRPEPAELDVDFALHQPAGPAARWAAAARPGDRVVLIGPAVADNRSVTFHPPADTDWVLLAGDVTALPALGAILEWLPPRLPVRAWIEVPDAADIQDLDTPPDCELHWLVGGAAGGAGSPAEAVARAELPAGTPYAWLAGESTMVTTLRRHLVRERGFAREQVKFSGYWRRGATEEQLRAEEAAAAAEG